MAIPEVRAPFGIMGINCAWPLTPRVHFDITKLTTVCYIVWVGTN